MSRSEESDLLPATLMAVRIAKRLRKQRAEERAKRAAEKAASDAAKKAEEEAEAVRIEAARANEVARAEEAARVEAARANEAARAEKAAKIEMTRAEEARMQMARAEAITAEEAKTEAARAEEAARAAEDRAAEARAAAAKAAEVARAAEEARADEEARAAAETRVAEAVRVERARAEDAMLAVSQRDVPSERMSPVTAIFKAIIYGALLIVYLVLEVLAAMLAYMYLNLYQIETFGYLIGLSRNLLNQFAVHLEQLSPAIANQAYATILGELGPKSILLLFIGLGVSAAIRLVIWFVNAVIVGLHPRIEATGGRRAQTA